MPLPVQKIELILWARDGASVGTTSVGSGLALRECPGDPADAHVSSGME